MSRLELLDLDDIPEEYHHLFTDDYLGDRHIFRAWAHNPEVLEATLEYLNVLYEQLGQRRKELVILTVARARGARYEWHQHVDIARDKGVSIAEMQAIGGDDFSMTTPSSSCCSTRGASNPEPSPIRSTTRSPGCTRPERLSRSAC
jgi:4-carboxymuconolactone decarboxylase